MHKSTTWPTRKFHSFKNRIKSADSLVYMRSRLRYVFQKYDDQWWHTTSNNHQTRLTVTRVFTEKSHCTEAHSSTTGNSIFVQFYHSLSTYFSSSFSFSLSVVEWVKKEEKVPDTDLCLSFCVCLGNPKNTLWKWVWEFFLLYAIQIMTENLAVPLFVCKCVRKGDAFIYSYITFYIFLITHLNLSETCIF